MSSDIKLLPCPFCGGEAEFVRIRIVKDIPLGFIRCTECGIKLRQENCTEDVARDEWNTRKPMDRIVEQLESDEKHTFDGCINKRYAIELLKAGGKV